MTSISSYQPFLIGQGIEKTGFFSTLSSWVKPEDAFDTLENAYVYKGSLFQRTGMQPYQSAAGNGALVYIDNKQIGVGAVAANGTYNNASVGYVALNTKLPITHGSVRIRTRTSAGVEVWVDNGAGVLSGSLGDTGTINYVTGAWSITLSGGRAIGAGIIIYGDYGYAVNLVTTGTRVYNPIMGIKQFTSPTTGKSITVVMDTRRASYYDQATKSFVGLNQFSQVIAQEFDTSVSFGPLTTQWINLTPYSVVVTDSTGNVMVDNGLGPTANFINVVATATPFDPAASQVTYASGVLTIAYPALGNPPIGTQITVTANVTGDYFTGDNTNFFNATTWRYNDVQGDFLYFTNNVDPVTLFDGTKLSRPLFNTTLASVQAFAYVNFDTIKTTLDIKVYKNRLQFLRPTLLGTTIPEAQTIRFSQQQEATVTPNVIFSSYNFASDVPGNGGFQTAPTGDWLMASQLIRDVLIVFFTNSTWIYRFTANAFEPYRFDQVNSTRSTNAPYGTIPQDLYATSMGVKGLIYCDGVNVDRFDQAIIEQFEDINQSGFGQCFGQKYDSLNHSWMLYPNEDNGLLTNDHALIYNYLENTWAIFIPNLGFLVQTPANINALSCLGLGLNVDDITWADFAVGSGTEYADTNWSQANFTWISGVTQTLSSVLLGGDQNGVVYQIYVGTTDNGNPIKTFVDTKRLNPFIDQGLKGRFGYLDVYYEKNAEITLSFNFYVNNSESKVKGTVITLDGPETDIWAWKRLYINAVGEFIQVEITNEIPNGSTTAFNTGGSFNILGMILHASPAGRLTPGTFI